jgi:hypothetical protein
MKCKASSTTGWIILHGSVRMGESLFLNKYEMVSSHVVYLKIGGTGNFLCTLYIGISSCVNICQVRSFCSWGRLNNSHSGQTMGRFPIDSIPPLAIFAVCQICSSSCYALWDTLHQSGSDFGCIAGVLLPAWVAVVILGLRF